MQHMFECQQAQILEMHLEGVLVAEARRSAGASITTHAVR